jgi:hypothetical protein
MLAFGGSGKNAQEWPELLRDCGCQGFDDGYVLQQLLRQAVSLLQIRQTVVGDPDLPFAILLDQNLKWEIDGDARSGQHEGRSCFGVSEHDDFGRRHLQPHLFCFTGMVNYHKNGHPLRL